MLKENENSRWHISRMLTFKLNSSRYIFFFLMRKLIDNFSTHSTSLFYNEFFNPHSVNRISGGCFPPIFRCFLLVNMNFYLMPSHSRWITHDEFFLSLTKRKICIIRWWKFKKSTARRNRNRRWKEEIFTWNLTFCVYQSQSQIAHDLTLFTLILWLLVLLIDKRCREKSGMMMLWIDHHWVDFNRWIVQITLSRAVDTFVKQCETRKEKFEFVCRTLQPRFEIRSWGKIVEISNFVREELKDVRGHYIDSMSSDESERFDWCELYGHQICCFWFSTTLGVQQDCELRIRKSHGTNKNPFESNLHYFVSFVSPHTNISSRVRVSFSWQQEQIGSEARKLMRKMCSIKLRILPSK